MALGGMGRNIGELLSRGYCNSIADRASAVLDALAVSEGGSVDLIASVRLCISLSLMCLVATVRFPPFVTGMALTAQSGQSGECEQDVFRRAVLTP
jgi:hypothetical protein